MVWLVFLRTGVTVLTCTYCTTLQDKYPGAKLRECRHEAKALDLYTPLHTPKRELNARIYIHPRCISGPASGALTACLQEHGYDINAVSIGPVNKRGYAELVRLHLPEPDGTLNLERMNGEKFTYKPVNPVPPSAA